MPWKSLSEILDTLPVVLTGPLLRKVTPSTVTVWLVTRVTAELTLKVFDPALGQLMEGKRSTVQIGKNLHMAAVTARMQPQHALRLLTEGVIYSYDVEVKSALSSSPMGLTDRRTAGMTFGYPGFDRPTFCLPPSDLNKLRLLHGSCRLPHGQGLIDAFPIVDDLIAQAPSNPDIRPHQLLLTGDQIYADDLAACMWLTVTDAAHVLMDWEEIIQVPNKYGGPRAARKVAFYSRTQILEDAGWSSVDLEGQLMSLGEYLTMYLLVWSDVLWGKDRLPVREEFLVQLQSYIGQDAMADWFVKFRNRMVVNYHTHFQRIERFRNALPRVRRMLANIPSYMIFDDHEVTDDWNMTQKIAMSTYSAPMSGRIMRNGMLAYALCQHWGNAPEQFEPAGSPGEKLLGYIDRGDATSYELRSDSICFVLGVPDSAGIATFKKVSHFPNSLIYNYSVEGPSHQIIVTDTRTWREYSYGPSLAAELLPQSQIAAQISNVQPPTGDRALLVVVSTNAPSTQPIRSAIFHQRISRLKAGRYPDFEESWELPMTFPPDRTVEPTDRLYRALANRLPVHDGVRNGAVMLLSGDVHHSFASRMTFKAAARFGAPLTERRTIKVVFAQLVSSSFRKEDDKTRGLHAQGYWYAPYDLLKRMFVEPHVPEGYAGWTAPLGITTRVGKGADDPEGMGNATLVDVDLKRPTTVPLSFRYDIRYTIPPDYNYTLYYLNATSEQQSPMTPGEIAPLPSGANADERKRSAATFHKAAGAYRAYNAHSKTTREIVGVNNVAEITFIWGAAPDRRVNHTIRWIQPKTGLMTFSTYSVGLDPDDQAFPTIEPAKYP